MKIRNGFVSNSSSSSFLIGVGRIKDFDRFNKWMKKKDIEKKVEQCWSICFNILTTSQIFQSDYWESKYEDGYLKTEACVNDPISVKTPIDPSKEEKYVLVRIGNDEGDSTFWNPQLEELEYDRVDRDWFMGVQKDILEMLEGNYLDFCEYKYGAARNG